ncbi:MAG: tetratricopeptide repeat protein [bacterium]|nr:tetratricopeptide repeat protein [bacterium]
MKSRFVLILCLLPLVACSFSVPDPATELAQHGGNVEEYRLDLERQATHDPQDPIVHYQLGWVLHNMGKTKEALPEVERAVALAPLSPRFRLLLGRLYQELGDHFQAVNLISSALKLDDRLLEGYFYLAKSLEETGRVEEALNQLNLALEIEPLYFDARLAWVRISVNNGDVQQSLEAQQTRRAEMIGQLEQALKIKPASVEGSLLLARLYRDQGAGFKARLILEDWLKRFGEKDRIIAELASIYAAQGEETEALELLASQKSPGPEARALMLRIQRGRVEPGEILTRLQDELANNPQNVSMRLLEGELMLEMGQVDRAERALQQVLKIEPKSADAYVLLAKAYVEQADYAGEQMALQKARTLAPGSLEVRLALLESLIRRGLWQEAQAQIAQTDSDQESRRMMLLKAYLAQMRGDYAEAESLIRLARKQGSDARSELAMARLEIARGLFDTGIARARELLTRHPKDFESKLVLAKGLLRAQKTAELERLLGPMLHQHRGEGRAHLLLARARLDQGQIDSAADLLAQGLKTWPRQPDLVQLYTASLGFLGRYKTAIPLLEEMLRFQHRYSDIFAFRLWEFYIKAGQLDRARSLQLPSER